MIRDRLKEIVESAFKRAVSDGKLGALTDQQCPEPIIIEKPKLAEHGDFACGVSMKLARYARTAPLAIANTIADYIREAPEAQNGRLDHFEVARPGFINFVLGKTWLCESLSTIHREKDDFARADTGNGKKVLIEYVSANPTGALHIGHGRGAVLGSCLANLFQFAGFNVEQEFYVNDTGVQIALLGRCILASYLQKHGRETAYPDEGYPQDYIEPYVDRIVSEHGDAFISADSETAAASLADLAKEIIRKEQEELLARLGVHFDRWFSEESLHESEKIQPVLDRLREAGYSYESEGALWLKADELGDERPRVLRKSSGAYTYLTADAAYHADKYERGYDLMINIWGADHHGQVPGLKAVMKALGYEESKLDVVLTQIVNLSREGKIVRMSKRQGTVVLLEEVMDEVGVDAVRYFLAESNPQNPINFDLDLAKKTSSENPAFYIQYAHARCCSILRRALEPYENPETGKEEAAPVDAETFARFKSEYLDDPKVFEAAFDEDPELFFYQKKLALTLASLPAEVEEASTTWQPGMLARYAYEVAKDLQKFYERSRVITDDLSVTRARLGLIMATRQVLANVLGIIGVSAPERM